MAPRSGYLVLLVPMLVALLARLGSSPMPHIPPCTPTTTGRQVAELENAATRRPLGHNAMAGKLVVITGGDSGIGLSTATAVARANATIVIASYDPDGAGADAATKIFRTTQNNKVSVLPLDLSSIASVRTFAATLLQQVGLNIDVLINCAGIAEVPGKLSVVTSDGFDRVFQTNYLGHFLLTELLLPRMRVNPAGARVINVASEASEVACLWADADANCLVPDRLASAVQRGVGRAGQNNSLGVASSACKSLTSVSSPNCLMICYVRDVLLQMALPSSCKSTMLKNWAGGRGCEREVVSVGAARTRSLRTVPVDVLQPRSIPPATPTVPCVQGRLSTCCARLGVVTTKSRRTVPQVQARG